MSRFKKFHYTPNVKRLAAVSFFTDLASEMLYPIMPLLWSSVGLSPQMIGIIEGLAEAVAGTSKMLWGYVADRFKNYRTLVIIGYSLSAVMKPLFGLTSTFIVPFFARNAERLGKAIRSAPRDAILAAECSPEDRPRVIGFHRAMDTLGAVVGPLLCLLLLLALDGDLKTIFLIAFIPGALAVLAAIFIDDRRVKAAASKPEPAPTKTQPKPDRLKISFKEIWQLKNFRLLVTGLGLFALINSSDMFIILRLRDLGLDNTMIVFAYTLYNIVYMIIAKTSYRITRKIGLKGSIIANILLFALTYGALSFDLGIGSIIAVLLAYGLFAGLFEVTSKAWLANVLPGNIRATGMGAAGTITSLGFLFACLLTGLLWGRIGSADTLAALAVLSVIPLVYFATVNIKEVHENA